MRNIHFLEWQLIFGTVRVSAFAAGVREQLVTRARNLARELQPSLLAKDVSPERKPLKAARRDGCIRRPVGIFICYLVTVSTSKYCISSSHMGAVLTCSLHDEWTKELLLIDEVPQRLIFISTILCTNSFLSLLHISQLLEKISHFN